MHTTTYSNLLEYVKPKASILRMNYVLAGSFTMTMRLAVMVPV